MHLRPQSFFQTNTVIAAVLYAEARDWIRGLAPDSAWDLYSGVGGFALHLAGGGSEITGIETSVEAVASAELSRTDAALGRLRFAAGDATEFALGAEAAPDLVVVNPPRRGIGAELAGWLEQSTGVSHVLYSSCNAASLAKDLRAMPSFAPLRARVFDMFPQTTHFEVMVLLERR
jgi:23S rRNA (uracil747-C5)-methyltransferase